MSSLCPHVVVPLCVLMSSYKDSSPVGSGTILMTPFHPNYFFRDPTSKCFPVLRSQGVGFNL